MSKKMKLLIVSVYTFLTALAIFAAYKANDFSTLDSDHSVMFPVEAFSNDFQSHRISLDQVGKQTYSLAFDSSELAGVQTKSVKLILNKLSDNAYMVFLNGQIIGHEGDMEQGRSMLKNSPNIITFDRQLIQKSNRLDIETYATYKSGLENDGVYFIDSITGMRVEKDLLFYGSRVILLGIGFLIFAAVLMIFIYFINKTREMAFIHCSLATLFIGIYFIDYMKVVSIPYDYFLFKKVFMVCLFIGAAFYTFAMGKFLKNKKLNYLTVVMVVSFIVMSLTAPNLIKYKELYEYWYLLLLVIILLWFISGLKSYKKNEHVFVFVAGFFFILLYSGFAILIDFFGGVFPINSPLVYIVNLATLPLLFGFEEIFNKEEQISYEQEQKANEFLNSITDALTGAWNQRYLYMKIRENPVGITLVIFDLDDFKQINDQYSHMAGDFVLKEVSDIFRKSIRKTDDFCRYGGDEFVVLLHGCEKREAYRIVEKLRKTISEYEFNYNNHIIHTTISIGIYPTDDRETLETALKKADKELYLSKQKGKNMVSIHEGDEV